MKSFQTMWSTIRFSAFPLLVSSTVSRFRVSSLPRKSPNTVDRLPSKTARTDNKSKPFSLFLLDPLFPSFLPSFLLSPCSRSSSPLFPSLPSRQTPFQPAVRLVCSARITQHTCPLYNTHTSPTTPFFHHHHRITASSPTPTNTFSCRFSFGDLLRDRCFVDSDATHRTSHITYQSRCTT